MKSLSICILTATSLAGIAGAAIGQDNAANASELVADTAPASPRVVGETVETRIPTGYELVWSDEFDQPGLPDPTKWTYDVYRNAEGWYNDEKQYYSASRLKNSRVEDGHLIIEAHREELNETDFPDWGGQDYSSARLMTKGLGDWTYGFFEVRAKIPCGLGTWPAIWTLPSDPDVEWPAGGEIDIMEHVGFEPETIHHSVHTTAFNFSRGSQMTSKHDLPGACDSMQKYQLLWTPDFLLFGVNDQPKWLFNKESSNRKRWPFTRPQHLLLNLAVGGTWGGQQGLDEDVFPARMEVDYVRVYQPSTIAGELP